MATSLVGGSSRCISCSACLLSRSQQQCISPMQRFFQETTEKRSFSLFMTTDDNPTEEPKESYNIALLKKETSRLILRTHKKIGKAGVRVRAAEDQYERLRLRIDEGDTEMDDELLKQLEDSPNLEEMQSDLQQLKDRLRKLTWLEEQFSSAPLKSKKSLMASELRSIPDIGPVVIEYVHELQISDDESAKQMKIEADARNRRAKAEKAAARKEQGSQKQGGRLPYRRYYTKSNVEIRVGKQATDNDELSLSPEHRSGAHWWYHASGCPGSHVVLCTDDASPSQEEVLDAASLAALKSKCINQSVIKVSMTRARNVSKPRGAKPGLVQLNGDVKTITVKKSEVEKRCQRLEETVVVN